MTENVDFFRKIYSYKTSKIVRSKAFWKFSSLKLSFVPKHI